MNKHTGMVAKSILILLSIMLLFSSKSEAISISGGVVRLTFEPNLEAEFSFYIGGAEKITAYVKGDLSEYMTIDDSSPGGGPRTITLKIKLPDQIETPGRYTSFVGAIEGSQVQGTVGGVAAIQIPIYIEVPYDGVYLETSFTAPDVNLNEVINFNYHVTNKGKRRVNAANVEIDVYDENNQVINSLYSKPKEVPGLGSIEFELEMDSKGMQPGRYTANAKFDYDRSKKEENKTFKVGTLSLSLINYTKEFEESKINKFDLVVESQWNSAINEMYAIIKVNNGEMRTPTVSLGPWQRKTITGYWDTTAVGIGEYNALISIYFDGNQMDKEVTVDVIEGKAMVTEAGLNRDITIMLIAVIVVLIIINIILTRRKLGKAQRK